MAGRAADAKSLKGKTGVSAVFRPLFLRVYLPVDLAARMSKLRAPARAAVTSQPRTRRKSFPFSGEDTPAGSDVLVPQLPLEVDEPAGSPINAE